MKQALFLFILFFYSCNIGNSPYKRYTYSESLVKKDRLFMNDIEIYKNTKAWDLAKAVYEQDTDRINLIARKDSSLINFHKQKFNITLLHWAIIQNRYYSARALLKAGANPNLRASNDMTAFIEAANNDRSYDYLKLIVSFKVDVNPVIKAEDTSFSIRTPLEAATGCCLKNVKLLVESGADLKNGMDGVLTIAFLSEHMDIAKYLIVDKGVNYKGSIMHGPDGKPYYTSDFLSDMKYEKGSENEKYLLEIVSYIRQHGIDTVMKN